MNNGSKKSGTKKSKEADIHYAFLQRESKRTMKAQGVSPKSVVGKRSLKMLDQLSRHLGGVKLVAKGEHVQGN